MVLFLAAGLTALLESAFFGVVGVRDRFFFLLCVLCNLASNLLLNCTSALLPPGWQLFCIYPLEVLVVVGEWSVLRVAWRGSEMQLFCLVLAANVLSYLCGFLIWGA